MQYVLSNMEIRDGQLYKYLPRYVCGDVCYKDIIMLVAVYLVGYEKLISICIGIFGWLRETN